MPQAALLFETLTTEQSSATEPTPLLAQYLAVKARYADALLFFRLGDFYELFFEDAERAAKALDIALTKRGQFQGKDVPMCGVPAHAYETYLARLMKQGFRVAICEQLEDPAAAKKRGSKAIVTRDVVRVVTPGTITEDSLLEPRAATYLACLAQTGEELAIAWIDLSSAEPLVQSLTARDLSAVLSRLDPKEILLPEKLLTTTDIAAAVASWKAACLPLPGSRFDSANAAKRLCTIYKVSTPDAFGNFSRAELAALGSLLDYVTLTQQQDLPTLLKPQRMQSAALLALDAATARNLELTRTLSGERHGSLLATIDRSVTGAGARLLANQLSAPLTDLTLINQRLDAISSFLSHRQLREKLRATLQNCPDLERALSRLTLGRGSPRDLAAVRVALEKAEAIKLDLLTSRPLDVLLSRCIELMQDQSQLTDRLGRALKPDLPQLARDGGFIAPGYSPALDELVMLRDESRRVIAGLQQKYAAQSGVAALKIKNNNILGYFIEVTPAQGERLLQLRDVFLHRQTLATSARFTTVELSDLERKLQEAGDKALALELQLFGELVAEVTRQAEALRSTAHALAQLDVSAALADLAATEQWCRPTLTEGKEFHVAGGRHPVVEAALRADGGKNFIGNDCDLSPTSRLWVITGPNMAGKSTFLRQNALFAVLAQMGSYVPASQATIGIVDKLFSRVGAADDLARGRSTFMVEMVETAAILNQATERSLVILDEIGRGTATHDGLSIAWAVTEYLHEVNRCRALFATHYHELTQLTETLTALSCHSMKVKEWNESIIFLHQVVAGSADRSWGIHVARMAGLPETVLARADVVLASLQSVDNLGEHEQFSKKLAKNLPDMVVAKKQQAVAENPVLAELQAIDLDALSPRDALDKLYSWKKQLKINQ